MISAEFAPNEQWDDALLSASLLVQPWRWHAGPETTLVRNRIAEMTGDSPENVHLYLSGRAGWHRILTALSLPAGSEVLVAGFTCEAVILPIIAHKCIPKYIDIDYLDYSSSPQKIPPLVSSNTRVLLIQHTFGIPPRRKELIGLAKKHNLYVVEDVAHGFAPDVFDGGGERTTKLISFGRSKSMSSVFGGAIVCPDPAIASSLAKGALTLNDVSTGDMVKLLNYKPLTVICRSLYNVLNLGKIMHRILMSVGMLIPELSAREKRGEYDPYFDKAYPNALAILLTHQMSKHGRVAVKRGRAVEIYRKALQGKIRDGLSLARYPVLVNDRSRLLDEAKRYGVYLGTWYTQPVAPRGIDLKKMGYAPGSCPVSEFVCDHIVNLPTSVSDEQAMDIAELVKPYLLTGEQTSGSPGKPDPQE